ncbi:MAG: cell division protein ZapA [Pseudomonadales bacterium]|nr:cell division protein ZapA [Pseudomonadales bacterium]
MGKEYQIACPEEQIVELKNAAAYLDQQMRTIRESGKVVGLERIAVMAALNITHELQNQDGEGGLSHEAADEHVVKISKKLDKALHQLKQLQI